MWCQRRFHLTNRHTCHIGTMPYWNNSFKNHRYGKGFKSKKLINHYLLNWVICQSWPLGHGTSQHLTSQARIVFPCSFCSRHIQYDISGNWDCGRHIVNLHWLCTRAHVNYLLLDKVISPVPFGALSQRVWETVLFHSVAALFMCWFVSSDLLVWSICFQVSWGGHGVWQRDGFLECKGLQFISLCVFFIFCK